ncbi:hypothetical protein VNO77_44294 [Canavalia gladiata]|uniref:Uncharacterized protein n=1 Tax=Canavalia gladiata TaxID=3824 RepID=A0AAN9JY97_CANGL
MPSPWSVNLVGVADDKGKFIAYAKWIGEVLCPSKHLRWKHLMIRFVQACGLQRTLTVKVNVVKNSNGKSRLVD